MEDQDMILPDGFEDTPTEEITADDDLLELDAEETTDTEDTKPVEEVTEPTEPEAKPLDKIKIKYNHEEKEIDLEEAKLLAQKGLNYEKAVERARQEAAQQARDEFIAQQGYEWNGKPIKTEAEYKQALQEKELMEKYKDLPDELRQELLASRKDREERQAEKQQQELRQQEQQQYESLLDAFPELDPKTIKPETWAKAGFTQDGYKPTKDSIPLKYAYMEQERAELLTRTKVVEQNQKNKQRAPVTSVSAHGTGETLSSDPFLDGFDS